MFEYKTRTEYKNSCKFIEQDILLYDYLYNGDTTMEVTVEYNRPGFGFVITEQQNNGALSENLYIAKIDKTNHYQIISKQAGIQTVARSEYINAGTSFNIKQVLKLAMEFTDDGKISVYKLDDDKHKNLMFSFTLPHLVDNYKLGYYSNAGNSIIFSSISSESPSNWISNIFNCSGGRINWIKNGFEIQDCLLDCEIESQQNYLEAGKYYFDFNTTNPDIKYYIYPAEKHLAKEQRQMSEILATKEDERKNILDYNDNSFIVEKPGNFNIKFKGKTGRVSDIAIKKNKHDSFVETDYNNIRREASYIEFDLSKIKKIDMAATVTSYGDGSYLFLNGTVKYDKNNYVIDLGKEYSYVIENRKINDKLQLSATEDKLICFKNVDAVISKLIVTYNNGDEVNVLIQKTVKVTVEKDITSPILVTDENGNPLDLSSSYRKVVIPSKTTETFNRYRQIKLLKKLDTCKKDITCSGDNNNLISYNHYKVDYVNNKIVMDKAIRDKYKTITVKYAHIENYLYEFTNWQRELFDLSDGSIYLSSKVSSTDSSIIVYGIPKDANTYKERLFYVPDKTAINTIDMFTSVHRILQESEYSLDNNTNKLSLDNSLLEELQYIVVDYLKDNSYCVNERDDYYEVDISSLNDKYIVLYDNPEKQYKTIDIDKNKDFIVLQKLE